MQIIEQYQYNQGISKYKLLSSTAGVGAIIATKLGYYVLISDINKWKFIISANERIKEIRAKQGTNRSSWYQAALDELPREVGVELVDDERFIEFIKREKNLDNLLCLGAIPHLSLSERTNAVKVANNPIIQRIRQRQQSSGFTSDNLIVPATHFPKWFINDKGNLRTYDEWKELWLSRPAVDERYFAPPRDKNAPVRTIKRDGDEVITIYKELKQLNLVLICDEGHLSDIPWSKFLRWKHELMNGIQHPTDGQNLFDIPDCCAKPDLRWTESKNKSEGYKSVFIECCNCKLGTGEGNNIKVNLEGINGLKPRCKAHKPWSISLSDPNPPIPVDNHCFGVNGSPNNMQVSLATGNNVYFANSFSSIYIPMELANGIPPLVEKGLRLANARFEIFQKNASAAGREVKKEDWVTMGINESFVFENYSGEIKNEEIDNFLNQLKAAFLRKAEDNVADFYEEYRWQEYRTFVNPPNQVYDGLHIVPTSIKHELRPFFKSIQKVEELKVSLIQLDFNRIRPSERVRLPNGEIQTTKGQPIFSTERNEVFILPATESYGEGIFFEFNNAIIQQWMLSNKNILTERIEKLLPNGIPFNANQLRDKIKENEAKLLLIHTFSHLLMRELEFSCGYPTASLKERLYISPRMSGVLIYTAEGSEGSMGGLIWQAQTEKMYTIITRALRRADDCSSDPLCWQSTGQGIYDMNLAACFSCSLVSETSCEERNLGLDRRVLIDREFGFFSSLHEL